MLEWRRTIAVAGIVATLGVLASACGGGEEAAGPSRTDVASPVSPGPSPSPPASSPAPSPQTSSSTAELLRGSKSVHFRTADGIRLVGRMFGSGTVGVVLSHQGGTAANQSDWWGMARLLADRGYRVLTYDFRGICPGGVAGCSGGTFGGPTQWKDLLAAVGFIRAAGARRVVVGGASIGAMASLVVAGRPVQHIAGVISLSGGEDLSGIYELGRESIQRISAPKLFIAGRYDREFAASARDWLRWATPPVDGRVLNTGLHGTDMLNLASGDDEEIPGIVEGMILRFLARYM